MTDLLAFVTQVEADLDVQELDAMIRDCIRITRDGDVLDESYIRHAFTCQEHMAALYGKMKNS